MNNMTIGKLAKRCGVGVETIRFYEREGLIEEPQRRDSGYRQYPEETARRVRFIKRAKELGFTLKEIRELLALRIRPEATCGDVRHQAEAKIADIEQRIVMLQKMKQALARLTVACSGRGPTSQCPILEAMEDDRDENGRNE
jgi:MerR family mercuric resistance operon transcriptional regulator